MSNQTMPVNHFLDGWITISGADALKFLQGQLTCDMHKIDESQPQIAAHCSPKGRIISLFFIKRYNDGYLLNLPKNMCDITIGALSKTIIFFKATMTDISEQAKTLGLSSTYPSKNDAILAKIPMVYPKTSELFLPHDIGLVALGGVSFHKGCYVGQEIIARMEHRGKLKKHPIVAKVTTDFSPGSKLTQAGKTIATVIDSSLNEDSAIALCVSSLTDETHPDLTQAILQED